VEKMPENKIGFTVMYQQPEDKKKFDKRYQKHLKVFEENVGNVVESAEVLKVDDTVFYQMAIVKLKPGTDFDAFMNSPEMKTVVDDVLDFVPADTFQVFPITQIL
jgi:recombinational DNA repair protein RecT